MFDHAEQLPKDPGSAARARRVLDRLGGQVSDDALDDAKLMVSELVANVVDHVPVPGEIGLRVALRPGTLRVEVTDSGPGFTHVSRRPDSPEASGWGLQFVEALASRWAVDRDGRARVWFEIDVDDTAQPA